MNADMQNHPWLWFAIQILSSGTIAAVVVAFLNHHLSKTRDSRLHRLRLISEFSGFLEKWKTEMQIAPQQQIYDSYDAGRRQFSEHAGKVLPQLKPSIRQQLTNAKDILKSYSRNDLSGDYQAGMRRPVFDFEKARHEVIGQIDEIGNILHQV
jgi:hypothetical protein